MSEIVIMFFVGMILAWICTGVLGMKKGIPVFLVLVVLIAVLLEMVRWGCTV